MDTIVIVATVWLVWLAYLAYQAWESRRQRMRRKRPGHYSRDLEHATLIEMGPPGEALLRRMLIEDLKQVRARRKVVAYMLEHYGVDIDEPTEIPPLFPWWPKRWRRKI